nr:hypothetical protein [Tanacetum cinerariifolium]
METVFRISNYTVENQIKFATCTLIGSALTWWNPQVKTVGPDVTYEIIWTILKKKMTDKYCQRGEIKKLEVELWNLKVKGTDVVTYNKRFQELALMYARIFPEESDKIERYISGLPDMLHGSVMASKPKTMQDAVEFATELMDKKICTCVKHQIANKRKQDDNQQQENKRSSAATNNQRNLTCFECGNQGNYKSNFLELKNQNHENQAEGTRACGMVHALGGGETNQDLNNMEADINS